MKRLLSETVKDLFGIDRKFSDGELVLFYLLVVITTGLVIYFL